MTSKTFRGALFAGTIAVFLTACGSSGDEGKADISGPAASAAPTQPSSPDSVAPETVATDTTPDETTGDDGVLDVPADFATIQDAVDAAAEGDLILIAPGTYNEAVIVETDNITIRGLDRNEVVLDGEFGLENGVLVAGANGVAVENLTAQNYSRNGFFWTGVTGYRGSYLTAYRNGDYGVYAFDSVVGQLDHIYAAGSPDAGLYIGQCFPCDALITDVISEHNGLGYSGTNSGGNLIIVNSIFRNNRAGIVPNSGSYELCYPERKTTIVGNLVYSNNQPDTPAIDVALLAMGNGILSAGGVDNIIERNRVWDHDKTGIGLVPFLEEEANDVIPGPELWEETCEESKQRPAVVPDGPLLWDSQLNRVVGNVLEDNREGDLVAASLGDASTLGNCFADNEFTTSAPLDIETLAPCEGTGSGDWTANSYDIISWLSDAPPPSVDYKTAVLPPLEPQDNMPDAATAPANPATNVPATVDLDAITVPDKPA